jgi:tRNA nucleotidyltransferase (CCA-adding enzyme)
MIDIDKLIERNDKAFKETKEKLEKLLSVETTTPEEHRDELYKQIEKVVDDLSLLHRRGGFYEFKKTDNNKQEH